MYHEGFNPRTRVGCDTRNMALFEEKFGFNPRTRVGCDSIKLFPSPFSL